MKKSDYILPIILGIVFLGIVIYFQSYLKNFLITEKDFSNEFFTFSFTLFGLTLTAYAILFGLIPSFRKDVKKSDTIQEINTYFKISLFILLFEISLSLIYTFNLNFYLFSANIFMIGLSLGMFFQIITLISTLFDFMINLT